VRRAKPKAKTASRGYGSQHQARRKKWASRIDAGELVPCARCTRPIYPGQFWDLGHIDGDKGRYAGPEHRSCNRAVETHRAKRGQPTRRRSKQERVSPRQEERHMHKWSRVWSWPIPDNVIIDPEAVEAYLREEKKGGARVAS
jgi:hypothetical protein